MSILLLITILLPLLGAVLLPGERKSARALAFVVSLVVFVLSGVVVAAFPGGTETFAATDLPWFGEGSAIDIRFSVALDGLSLWLYALTTLLVVVSVLVSWEAIKNQASLFYRLLLLLETGMLGVFCARDILLFYVFFEFTLIPLFFLIGIWGSEERLYAAIKFFLFTLAGSLLTFLGLLTIILWVHYHPLPDVTQAAKLTFSIPALTEHLARQPIDPTVQICLFAALFAGFAIKVPLFPLHTWLPLAHVQAPAAGSILLAGVLLKIGTYGFLRFSIPMLAYASALLVPWMILVAVVGIVYGSLVALAQSDMKKLIAYSSVAHLGFCMAGLFAIDRVAVAGGALQMINHGLSTGALFALVGMIYERFHTRRIADYGGMAKKYPFLAYFFLVVTFSSIGLPGLNGFVGEFMILIGLFRSAWLETGVAYSLLMKILSVVAVSGVVLGAWYMLQLCQRVFFGPLKEPKPHHPAHESSEEVALHAASTEEITDLRVREIFALAPLVVVMFWIGLQPKYFLDRMTPTLDQLTAGMRAEQQKIVAVPKKCILFTSNNPD